MKQNWLAVAEVIDALRLFPRVVLLGYLLWMGYVVDRSLSWYYHLAAADRRLEASGFCFAVIGVVTGLSPFIYKIYAKGGRKWVPKIPIPMSETTISNRTTVK